MSVLNSDGTPASVQSIHDTQAQNGDTITLPAGTFTWTSGVRITKSITLQGQGIGTTIIRDAITSSTANPTQFLLIGLVAGKLTQLVGIEAQDGGRTVDASSPHGCIRIDGDNTSGAMLRVHGCKFNALHGNSIVADTVIGVIDHCDFVLTTPGIYVAGSHWNGDALGKGDQSWAADTAFGTSGFLFIEDCNVSLASTVGAGLTKGITDSAYGGRFVVRKSTFNNTTVQTHGTESSGRVRGVRAVEIYNNNFNFSFQTEVGSIRSGVVLMHDNTCNIATTLPLWAIRLSSNDFPWGAADGGDEWDVNDPTIYATGTVSAVGSLSMTDSTANWAPNQWVGYSVRDATIATIQSGYGSYVVSNTANTITFAAGHDPGVNIAFAVGHTYQLRKVVQALDAPGRAKGSLITGAPVNPPPAGWNNQATEGCYQWGNTNLSFRPATYVTRLNEHFFQNTPMPGYSPYTYPHPLIGATPAAQRIIHLTGNLQFGDVTV